MTWRSLLKQLSQYFFNSVEELMLSICSLGITFTAIMKLFAKNLWILSSVNITKKATVEIKSSFFMNNLLEKEI